MKYRALILMLLSFSAYAQEKPAIPPLAGILEPPAVAAGKIKSIPCSACHGPEGNSAQALFPKLAGQNAKYTVSQLQAYQKNERSNPLMTAMAATLTEQDIQDLAAYYAYQKPAPTTPGTGNYTQGMQVYLMGNTSTQLPACASCHDPQGLGNGEAGYPRLRNQYSAYIHAQLLAYQKKERHNAQAALMQTIALKMSAQEMQAISDYIENMSAKP